MSTRPTCEICGETIDGEPFALSDLSDTSRILEVCERCGSSRTVTISLEDIRVTIDRDDYLACDKDRLERALGAALFSLQDFGWELDAITIQARSDGVNEPLP